MADRPRQITVVGGGITGLAAAHRLLTQAPDDDGLRVIVLEASDRFGGWVRTEEFAGRRVDFGPDSLLTRAPWAAELASELGIADDLVAPAAGTSLLLSRGRLRALPRGIMAGLPDGPMPFVRSGLLGPLGVGIAAIVVDGLVRDVPGLLDADIPVFTRGHCPNAGYRNGPGEINLGVVCGGVAINPGDILVGDRDGVVAVPLAGQAIARGQTILQLFPQLTPEARTTIAASRSDAATSSVVAVKRLSPRKSSFKRRSRRRSGTSSAPVTAIVSMLKDGAVRPQA